MDDDLEVALGVLLVAEGVPASCDLASASACLDPGTHSTFVFRGTDDERQASTDDGTLGTCGEIQSSVEFSESCSNTAMVQVCAEKYYPYVECLYEAAAIHASDGDLVCVELDCAAALGSSTSNAVAARPAALVAFTCAALVLYWAALPVAR